MIGRDVAKEGPKRELMAYGMGGVAGQRGALT